MTAESHRNDARLTLELIDDDRLEVAAHGYLGPSCQPMLTERLARLVACRPAMLRVDFGAVTFIDPAVVDTFTRAGSILAGNGGRLEVFGAQSEVAVELARSSELDPAPVATQLVDVEDGVGEGGVGAHVRWAETHTASDSDAER